MNNSVSLIHFQHVPYIISKVAQVLKRMNEKIH